MHTLPKTQVRVPDALATIRLRPVSQYQTRNGVGFLVDVIDGHAQRLGQIENQGNGGGTWFRHDDVEARRWWDALQTEYLAMPEALEDLNRIYAEVGLPPTDAPHLEALADALAEEALL